MKINEILPTDEIKVSKHSWTVKRNGKTAGIIRNITCFNVINAESPRRAFEAFQKIKRLENRDAKISRGSMYEHEGIYYYLYNNHTETFYRDQLDRFGRPLVQEEYDRFILRKNAVDELKSKMPVVSAIVV